MSEENKAYWVSNAPIKSLNTTPNFSMIFHKDGETIGGLDFNGPEMKFTGDADESAKIFIDYVATSFAARLEMERQSSQPEIDSLKEQNAKMREALGYALFALRHPDDGWRNDVINRAMKICSEALAQGEHG